MRQIAHFFNLEKPFTLKAYDLRRAVLEQFPDSEPSDMIAGPLRRKVVYPRIHFTVIAGRPAMVGMGEGADATAEFSRDIREIRVDENVWNVTGAEELEDSTSFDSGDKIYTYRFLTPWAGLNRQNLPKFRYLYGTERIGFLNKMLSQNIIFLMKEFGYAPEFKIKSRIRLKGLNPSIDPELGMGLFNGEFSVNVYLPEYLAMGCGISRGLGTISCLNRD